MERKIEKPKFNVGDVVWVIEGNGVTQKKIFGVGISGDNVEYFFREIGMAYRYDSDIEKAFSDGCYQKHVFATKEELLASL